MLLARVAEEVHWQNDAVAACLAHIYTCDCFFVRASLVAHESVFGDGPCDRETGFSVDELAQFCTAPLRDLLPLLEYDVPPSYSFDACR